MAVVASAPGKVLMTGGYLILERPNAGLVLSTNARFYAIIKPIYEEIKPDWQFFSDIKLTSPQLGRESIFKLSLKDLTLEYLSSRMVQAISDGKQAGKLSIKDNFAIIFSESRNPFVEQAVQYSVAAAYAIFDEDKKDSLHILLLHGLDITILGCNEFYSYRNQIEAQGLPLTPEALAAIPPFASISFNATESNGENCKPEVAKTGLGSSAAMTTAVVSALLHYLGVITLSSSLDQRKERETADLDLIHVIAQSAHCFAQGKVGSGFDVSSAVYGSQRYVRFSPEVLSPPQTTVKGMPLETIVADILKGNWDHMRTKFSLPPLMTLMLGEPGAGGSSTPSMVGVVKKWQKSDPKKSMETWRKLSEANSKLETHLILLSKFAIEHWDAYQYVINKCSILKSHKWIEQATESIQKDIVKALHDTRESMLGIRYHMREMGVAAGVPIEPDSQTRLLDTTMEMEGILLAGVPGAGGFDAIFAVVLGDCITNVAQSWSSLNVLALLVREDPSGVTLENGDPRTKKTMSAVSTIKI